MIPIAFRCFLLLDCLGFLKLIGSPMSVWSLIFGFGGFSFLFCLGRVKRCSDKKLPCKHIIPIQTRKKRMCLNILHIILHPKSLFWIPLHKLKNYTIKIASFTLDIRSFASLLMPLLNFIFAFRIFLNNFYLYGL